MINMEMCQMLKKAVCENGNSSVQQFAIEVFECAVRSGGVFMQAVFFI